MKLPAHPRPTEGELEILQVLWTRGPATVRQVYEDLAQTKPVGYTTVLKLMQIMHEKGLVRVNKRQRAHVYEAKVRQDHTQCTIVGEILDRVFAGSAARLVMRALQVKRATPEELAEIRQVLDELSGEPASLMRGGRPAGPPAIGDRGLPRG